MQAPFNDLYAASVDVMKRLAESNGRAWDRFTEQQVKLLGVCADCGQRQFALWNGNGVQKPVDFFAAQADIARQLSAHFIEYSKVMFTGTLDAAKETVSRLEDLPNPSTGRQITTTGRPKRSNRHARKAQRPKKPPVSARSLLSPR